MESSKKQHLLSRYYEGAQLTPKEQEEFKLYLQDEAFKEEVQFNEILTQVIQADHQSHPLKIQFQELEKKIRTRKLVLWIVLVIVVVGFLIAGAWYYSQK